MSVFAVIASSNPDALKKAVVTQYGANHHEFASNVWFVPDSGTSKTVADKLGLTNGTVGALGVVLRFNAFSGYANKAGWTWLESYPEAISNG